MDGEWLVYDDQYNGYHMHPNQLLRNQPPHSLLARKFDHMNQSLTTQGSIRQTHLEKARDADYLRMHYLEGKSPFPLKPDTTVSKRRRKQQKLEHRAKAKPSSGPRKTGS